MLFRRCRSEGIRCISGGMSRGATPVRHTAAVAAAGLHYGLFRALMWARYGADHQPDQREPVQFAVAESEEVDQDQHHHRHRDRMPHDTVVPLLPHPVHLHAVLLCPTLHQVALWRTH